MKKAFGPVVDSAEDLYNAGEKFYVDKEFFDFDRRIFGESPNKFKRALWAEVEANMEEQTFNLDEGRRPKSLFDKMIAGAARALGNQQ